MHFGYLRESLVAAYSADPEDGFEGSASRREERKGVGREGISRGRKGEVARKEDVGRKRKAMRDEKGTRGGEGGEKKEGGKEGEWITGNVRVIYKSNSRFANL